MEPTIEQDTNPARPSEVTRAVQLLSASLAIGLLRSILNLVQRTSGTTLIVALVVVVAFFVVCSFIVLKISAGKNWARIVVLIIVVILLCFIPFAVPAYLQELRQNVFVGLLGILITLLQLVGTYLLFTKNSNQWFRTRQ